MIGLLAPLCAHADAAFHIECPPDVTVDCDAELYDLSVYGWAYVYGYGGPVPADDPYVHYNLNSCGTGYVSRTWTAYDYQNNPHTCTQYIYVGGGGFSEYNIHWPPNYMTADCNASLHPDDLPAPYDYPTYDHLDCANIMIGYDDMVFNFGGGCKKILRTWSVLDWCTYDPGNPYGGGRWQHVQVLKVKPDGALTLMCPDDIVASAGANCGGTYVSIPPVTGMGACGSSVQVTNHSPYAQSNGADASGYYPFGTTIIKFTAEDACGNWESCYVTVTIKDMKKPTPICYNGLTANLMMQTDGYYIDLDAEWFNKGSFDNCTPEHQLRFRIEPERFTCDDLGEQDVKVYVIDLDGNEQYCNTYVIIQDNMGMCPPIDSTTYTISGSIMNLDGNPVSDMDVSLMHNGQSIDDISSNPSGAYEFTNVMNSEDYTIQPVGNDDYTLGISTFDLLQVARHVGAIEMFGTNTQLIAADANQDGEVDPADILELRKLLLQHTTSLPNNRAWRFFNGTPDELEELEDMTVDIDQWSVESLADNIIGVDFTAIKIGDVNGSVQNVGGAQQRTNPTFNLLMRAEGDYIHFIAEQSVELSGMQLGLAARESLALTSDLLGELAPYQRILDEQTLMSWYKPGEAVQVEKGATVFSIKGSADLLEQIRLRADLLSPELYSAADVIYEVKINTALEREEAAVQAGVQVFPNPLTTSQSFTVVSEHPIVSVKVYDVTGRTVLLRENQLSNEAVIATDQLGEGLFMVEVNIDNGETCIKKLVVNRAN